MRVLGALAALGPPNTAIPLASGGRFAYHLPPASSEPLPLPLLLIGGTSQSLSSWGPHVPALSRSRLVLTFECVGQGPFEPSSSCSMSAQVSRLSSFLNAASITGDKSVDLAGLSFGGRVCLAASRLGVARKTHLSGVSLNRDAVALRVLEKWREILGDGDLRAFAESIVEVSYSTDFRERNEKWIPKWLDFVESSNTAEGVLKLLNESHLDDSYGVTESLRLSKSSNRFLLGEMDVLCGAGGGEGGVNSAMNDLLAAAGNGHGGRVVEGCGHGVPLEASKLWREDLLRWLDS